MTRLRNFLLFILILCVILVTTGCWAPESFKANIMINKDGSYTCTYDGILTFMVAAEAASKRSLSQKDEAFFEEEAKKNKPDGFKEFEYLGKGRYKTLSEKHGKPKEPDVIRGHHTSFPGQKDSENYCW